MAEDYRYRYLNQYGLQGTHGCACVDAPEDRANDPRGVKKKKHAGGQWKFDYLRIAKAVIDPRADE
jgi:hypothetical protein